MSRIYIDKFTREDLQRISIRDKTSVSTVMRRLVHQELSALPLPPKQPLNEEVSHA